MTYNKNFFFLFFLIIFFICGSINSLKTGISFDEYHEQKNWEFHLKLIKNYLNYFFNSSDYDPNIKDEYVLFLGYGVGFQIISQPIQFIIKNIILLRNFNINPFGALLVSKHFIVFSFFFTSGIFLFLILKKIVKDEDFQITCTVLYLTYPYLFGQSLFSPKDIPFMSIWLVCTYVSFNILKNY